MMQKKFFLPLLFLLATLLVACGGGSSDGGESSEGDTTEKKQSNKLTVYAAFPEQESMYYLKEFEKETGIDVKFVRLSAGQVLARVQAEASNPQASVWYGGPSDTFIAAAELDLLEKYEPEGADEIAKEFTDENWTWSPVYVGALGFATNTDWLEKNNVEAPSSWEDLLKPEFKDNISIAHPASSGTAYSVMATLIQLMGEEEAFEYLEKLDGNIRQYTQSGSAPANNAGLGEVAVGIAFAHDILAPLGQGYPLNLSFPSEGTGSEIGAVALIKGGPEDEVENAQKFIDWAVSKQAQDLFEASGHFRLPVREDAVIAEGAIPLSEVNLIDYDAEWAGEHRDDLINKFDQEIRSKDAAE